MQPGKIWAGGRKNDVEKQPLHPYTRALLSAIPRPNPRERRLVSAPLGEIPSAVNRPTGCHYHPRCPVALDICKVEYPPLELKEPGHWVACHAVSPMSPLPLG